MIVPFSSTPLVEATSILVEAIDSSVDIDWKNNPQSIRESEWRAAMIRRIEVETAADGFDAARQRMKAILARLNDQPPPARDEITHVAYDTYCALLSLVDYDDDVVGEDLFDALERWEAAKDSEAVSNRKIELHRLKERARLDIGPPMNLT